MKKIVISNLAARYYLKDGWTLDILNRYLVRGRFVCSPNTDEDPYFLLDVGGNIDVDRFLTDYPDAEIKSGFHGEREMAPRELLISRNW